MKIRPPVIRECLKLKKIYDSSSQQLKDNFHPAIITRAFLYLVLSRTFLKYILPKKVKSLIALENNEIIGFTYVIGKNNNSGIFVREGHQGKGIGTSLLKEMQKYVNHMEAQIYLDNPASLRTYEGAGFKTTKEVRYIKWKK
jgi:GNAT superfamily N-acetyltransferase